MSALTVPRCPTLLVILDGFGVNPSKKNNAIYEADTPNLDRYFGSHPHVTINASGRAVGLPRGQMGNSEVGHYTLGCGAIYMQNLVRISESIRDGSFKKKDVLLNAFNRAKELDRPIHLIGLVSDGGVHSHTSHLLALLEMAKELGVKPVVHVITDGRDTAPTSAKTFLSPLQHTLDECGGEVATVSGRYYAMDRDSRWDRTQIAWDAIVNAKGIPADSMLSAVDDAYANGENDEFIKPRSITGAEKILEDDQLIFFNFRNDRPRQMADALGSDDFVEFDRGHYKTITVTCLTEYDKNLLAPVVFAPEEPATNLSHIISLAGHKQLHVAETEKYAHVTFFFNGGRETPYAGESRTMIDSPNVDTYDLQPEMSAQEVANTVIDAVKSGENSFIVVNFANGDMVGHSAVPEAVVKAVEVLDKEVGRVLDSAVENNYSVILTADHGNCDEYIDPLTGEPHTQHTIYPVPCLIIDKSFWRLDTCGGLSSIAPTVLQLMGLHQPAAMTGESILLEEIPKHEYITDSESPY
ncbi:MAG: 2,3-bisphosphoglycerate-independent phosphoglycerate mutase (EC [uncultured Thiotrichaceae bacterium]|uniref:2,3-bisphosphoglycerate-independent phosphoglycerate mutase n=1 Tax=uncultured Thiotrichaceae bacterium TaxID=298394 RepID=A0A6S6TT04_9GAMM|nr:MAG: 2,3-bisphosphoglycerate-independent phosphoglycerate mutase (EC [uncultured Thiotrichaceae bacterium]